MQTYLMKETETGLSVRIQPIGGRLLRKLTKRLGSILAFLSLLNYHMRPLNPPIQY